MGNSEPIRLIQKWVAFLPVALLPLALGRGEHLPARNVLDDPAFDHFYNLEYDQALSGFEAAAAKAPESADVYDHIAQTILFREMFRAGMLQSEMLTNSNSFLQMSRIEMSTVDQQQFTSAIGRAMELAQSRLKDHPDDSAALYALGVSYGLRGNYNFAVRKAYLDALRDMSSARKFHNRVTRIDPALVDAQLTQGVYDYVVGNLSFGWRMLGFLGGFQGDRARGIATLERVANQGNTNRIDATIFLAAIYRREHRSAEAISVLKPLISLLPRNYLLRLELAGMYGDLGDRDAALDALDQLERLWRGRAPGYEMLTADLLQKVREHVLTNVGTSGGAVGRDGPLQRSSRSIQASSLK
jgi:tetratricopeptide (TPR) repeat protein